MAEAITIRSNGLKWMDSGPRVRMLFLHYTEKHPGSGQALGKGSVFQEATSTSMIGGGVNGSVSMTNQSFQWVSQRPSILPWLLTNSVVIKPSPSQARVSSGWGIEPYLFQNLTGT